jgi:hypothetical protein
MIAKSNIERSLKSFNRLYKTSIDPRMSLFYSKFAIIELCGWIEESMDEIILKSSKRLLKNQAHLIDVEKVFIKRNYSFEYGNNFKSVLMRVIGLKEIEKIESLMSPANLTLLQSTLDNLKKIRDRIAHTHITGSTLTIDAPTITINNFNNVYTSLKEYERILKKLKL